MVTRFENWPLILSEYLTEKEGVAFEWYKNDCSSFIAEAVKRITGEDFFKLYNDYHDERSAAVLLKKNGGPSGIITKCLGEGSTNILMAKRGDIVVVNEPLEAAGIVDDSGQRVAVLSKEGLIRIPLTKAKKFWSY